MKLKLNTLSAILTVLFYLIFTIFTTLIVTLFFVARSVQSLKVSSTSLTLEDSSFLDSGF